jgi:hypothetical protein
MCPGFHFWNGSIIQFVSVSNRPMIDEMAFCFSGSGLTLRRHTSRQTLRNSPNTNLGTSNPPHLRLRRQYIHTRRNHGRRQEQASFERQERPQEANRPICEEGLVLCQSAILIPTQGVRRNVLRCIFTIAIAIKADGPRYYSACLDFFATTAMTEPLTDSSSL